VAAAEVVAELDTDLGSGLRAAEAAGRLQRDGPNELEAEKPLPAWQRFVGQFAEPLIYLLIAAAVVAIAAWGFGARRACPSTRS
jgi:P-type Ca2+ transporter type 2C